jgi:hypothetical protein
MRQRFRNGPAAGVVGILLAALSAAPASAQKEPGCWVTRDGTDVLGNTPAYYDAALTAAWMRTLQAADARLMATLAGVYYTEIPAPQLGMVSRQFRTYSANGLFEYRDQTCSATGCSTNQGHGRWAAYGLGGNRISLMITWTDLIRVNACAGGELRHDARGLTGADGSRWQRVQ